MVQMRNISYKYGGRDVLDSVSLSIKKGEFWVLFGGDDAGKTVLLHLLMGYDIYFRGKVLLMGSRPNQMESSLREKVRYVPDDLLCLENVTGKDFLQFAARMSGRYDQIMEQGLCRYFNLRIQQPLMEMSYQDNKLIQIVAALAARPELLILDEPMNILEADIWDKVLDCIRGMWKKRVTVLVTATEYEDMRGTCDHFAYLRKGRLITGNVQRNTGNAKFVTAVRGESRQTGIYRGSMSKLQRILTGAGFQDWTIEKLTLREELDMTYEGSR